MTPNGPADETCSPKLQETLTSRETAFSGRLITVHVDTVRLPGGQQARREVVRHRGAVAAVALDDDGQVHLVRQWRHPAERALLEIPAGTLDAGEGPEACVRRELAEEIGMAPGRLDLLISLYVAPGYSDEVIHIYLARDLRPESLPADADENLVVVRLPLARALEECRTGAICDGKSVAGLYLAAALLGE